MVEDFRMYLLREHKSLNTIKTYCRSIEEFIKWYQENEDTELYDIRKEYIKNYKNYLRCVKKQKQETITVKLCALTMYNRFLNHTNI